MKIGLILFFAVIFPTGSYAADGKLTGFGNIPFGMSMEDAKKAKGIKILEATDNLLKYETTVSDLSITAWQRFRANKADKVEVIVESSMSSLSDCDALFDKVYGMLSKKYGASDAPISERIERKNYGGLQLVSKLREASFSFSDGAVIREKRKQYEGKSCSIRLFYTPGSGGKKGQASF
jgi:hypothetical protein